MQRIIAYAFLYTFILVGIIVVGMSLASRVTWYYTNPIYQVLSFFERGMVVYVPVFLICGYLFIVYLELRKAYAYVDDISYGVQNINNRSVNMIRLNYEDLSEINALLNSIKSDIEFNERAAKEAEQRKNDLVVYLAHDLKTPLTSIIGYLTLLRDEKDIPQKSHDHYIEVTLDKAERLEDLINEFFEITRFNLTQQVLELSYVDMVRLLEQLTYEFKPMLKNKNLDCILHAPQSLEMKCDIQKMQRVLDNLLRNAVNYSFENTEIHITLTQEEAGHKIVFENKGNTIPKEKLDYIFEQFFRLDSSRTSQTGGAGLGLSISKSIVEQHQGTIKVDSYDERIIFEVFIPQL
ncbi:MAG: HAMP domain-containing histidine kinase [Erysipelotrichales bacterium]|nr:HAMP domain-containing histidine kinase [Erysipelotrichales bacterium]